MDDSLKQLTPESTVKGNDEGLLSGVLFSVWALLLVCIATGLIIGCAYSNHIDHAFNSVMDFEYASAMNYLMRLCHVHLSDFIAFLLISYLGYGLYSRNHVLDDRWRIALSAYCIFVIVFLSGHLLLQSQMSFWSMDVLLRLRIVFAQWLPFFDLRGVNAGTISTGFIVHIAFSLIAAVLVARLTIKKESYSEPKARSMLRISNLFWLSTFALLVLIGMYWAPFATQYLDDSLPARPLVTPAHIMPRWYVLPFYAILRAIPDKLIGVLCVLWSIFILFCLPKFKRPELKQCNFTYKSMTLLFLLYLFLLSGMGSLLAEGSYLMISRILTFHYFVYFAYQWCSSRGANIRMHNSVKFKPLVIAFLVAYSILMPVVLGIALLIVFYVWSSICQSRYKRLSLTVPKLTLRQLSGRLYFLILCLVVLIFNLGLWYDDVTIANQIWLIGGTLLVVIQIAIFKEQKLMNVLSKEGHHHSGLFMIGSSVLLLISLICIFKLSDIKVLNASAYWFYPIYEGLDYLFFPSIFLKVLLSFAMFLLPFILPVRTIHSQKEANIWGNLPSLLFISPFIVLVIAGLTLLLALIVKVLWVGVSMQGMEEVFDFAEDNWLWLVVFPLTLIPYVFVPMLARVYKRIKRMSGKPC